MEQVKDTFEEGAEVSVEVFQIILEILFRLNIRQVDQLKDFFDSN